MKKSVVVLFLLMSTFLNAEDKTASTANAPAPPPPPVAKSVHTENHINGGKLVDDYRWLRDKSNPGSRPVSASGERLCRRRDEAHSGAPAEAL